MNLAYYYREGKSPIDFQWKNYDKNGYECSTDLHAESRQCLFQSVFILGVSNGEWQDAVSFAQHFRSQCVGFSSSGSVFQSVRYGRFAYWCRKWCGIQNQWKTLCFEACFSIRWNGFFFSLPLRQLLWSSHDRRLCVVTMNFKRFGIK